MDVPIRFAETQQVAPDTHVIRQIGDIDGVVSVFVNSTVIVGAEPVIVDCGPAITKAGWIERVFELVEPTDVRWIYLSHDDSDHVGNLNDAIAMCPNANIVMTAFMVERLMGDIDIPMDRLRWINDGESFVAGDRVLTAMTPPTFDSPTTRGLFDSKTGVYWAADSFATVMTHEAATLGDLDPEFVAGAFVQTQQMVSPWTAMLDQKKFDAHVERIRALDAKVITSGHGPAIVGHAQLNRAFSLLRELPNADMAPLPGQAELDAMLQSLAA